MGKRITIHSNGTAFLIDDEKGSSEVTLAPGLIKTLASDFADFFDATEQVAKAVVTDFPNTTPVKE
jgi:hypothetical protein